MSRKNPAGQAATIALLDIINKTNPMYDGDYKIHNAGLIGDPLKQWANKHCGLPSLWYSPMQRAVQKMPNEISNHIVAGIKFLATYKLPAVEEYAQESTQLVNAFVDMHPKKFENAGFRDAISENCKHNPEVADHLAQSSSFIAYASNHVLDGNDDNELRTNIVAIAATSSKLAAKLILHTRDYEAHGDTIIEACSKSPELAKRLLNNTHFFNWCVEYFLKDNNGVKNWLAIFELERKENTENTLSKTALVQTLIDKDKRFYVLHNLVKTTHFDRMKENVDEQAPALPYFNDKHIAHYFEKHSAIKKRRDEINLGGYLAGALPYNAIYDLKNIYRHDSDSHAVSIGLLKRAKVSELVGTAFNQTVDILMDPSQNIHSSNFRFKAAKILSSKVLNTSWYRRSDAWKLDTYQVTRLMLAYGTNTSHDGHQTETTQKADAKILHQLFQKRKKYVSLFKSESTRLTDQLSAAEWLTLAADGSITYLNTLLEGTDPTLTQKEKDLGIEIKRKIVVAIANSLLGDGSEITTINNLLKVIGTNDFQWFNTTLGQKEGDAAGTYLDQLRLETLENLYKVDVVSLSQRPDLGHPGHRVLNSKIDISYGSGGPSQNPSTPYDANDSYYELSENPSSEASATNQRFTLPPEEATPKRDEIHRKNVSMWASGSQLFPVPLPHDIAQGHTDQNLRDQMLAVIKPRA